MEKRMKINIDKSAFNEVYWPYLFDYSHRYEQYYGSAGSGKSYFITAKLLLKALKFPGIKILIIRKVQATQRESTWRLFIDMLSQWKILDKCKVNKVDYTIELFNGSIFIFKGMDDPEKVKSIAGIKTIWIEECSELNEEDYSQLDLRLRAQFKYLQLIISFNPTSKEWFGYKRWYGPDAVIPDNMFILKTTYKDNKFLPEDYIKSLEDLKYSNPTYYKIYVEGEFATLDRLVFSNFKQEFFDPQELKGMQLCTGLDWGFSADPTAGVRFLVDTPNKKIYIFDEIYQTDLTNPDIYKLLVAKGWSKDRIICDAAEPKSIEELKRLGITRAQACYKGKDSILFGINFLKQFEIIIHPACENTFMEFNNYTWKKDKNGEYTSQTVDSYNHIIDALRYGSQIVNKKKVATYDIKGSLGL